MESPMTAAAPQPRVLPLYPAGSAGTPWGIRTFDEQVTEDTVWEPHSHATHELLWNERGASTATVGRRTWTITPQLGLWMPAGLAHRGQAPAGTWYRTAHFAVGMVGAGTGSALGDDPVAVEIAALLRLLLRRLEEPELSAHSRRVTETLVLDVLTPSPRGIIVHTPASALLAPIVAAVFAAPAEPHSLEGWASELGVSQRTVARAFRKETGVGFARWLASVRAQRAVGLLGQGIEMEEIAARVGYASVSAFGAAFRRVTGVTPGAFRPVRFATGGVDSARLRSD